MSLFKLPRFIPIFQSAHKHWDHSILPRRSIHAVYYDLVLPDEIETVWKLEKQGAVNSVSVLTTLDFLGYEGFPSDEADSLETLRNHQILAPDLFLGAFIPSVSEKQGRRLIGYTFATLSPIPRYTQASLTTHVPGTTTICAHTLCVDSDFRGASIGLNLLAEFASMCRKKGKYDRMVFMAKESLVPKYERIGFKTIGKAEVELGKSVWLEMYMSFR